MRLFLNVRTDRRTESRDFKIFAYVCYIIMMYVYILYTESTLAVPRRQCVGCCFQLGNVDARELVPLD